VWYRLRWPSVSFLLHVKYTASYHIVSRVDRNDDKEEKDDDDDDDDDDKSSSNNNNNN